MTELEAAEAACAASWANYHKGGKALHARNVGRLATLRRAAEWAAKLEKINARPAARR